jgi:CheY-like chemotaxis protein
MVHGFVEQSGGFVEIHSKVGQGSCVFIFLPRANDETLPDRFRSGEDDAPPGKAAGVTILVVEDDADVRKLVVMLLLQLGHDTVEAEDSAAALALLEENPSIDVLFTDIVLPGGTSGVDLAEKAQRRWPHLKIVYSSGYPDGELPEFFNPELQPNFIRKPYRKADLAETLEALLGDLPRDRTFLIC